MHRTKKITVAATAVALLMAAGMTSAMAASSNANDGKTTICHYRGNGTYKEITVANSSLPAHRRHHGGRDVIPAPPGGCSTVTPPPPGDGGDDHHDCIASSDSGNSTQSQRGLVNVGNINLGLNTLLAGPFCQANVANGFAIAGVGDAVGGILDSGSGDGDCLADSISGNSNQDQDGAVNVGNINGGLNNALAGAFCQADVLNGLALSLVGPAFGGSSLGSDLLSGGPLGLLSGAPGYLLSGITTDVRVIAGVLVHF